MYGMEFVSDFKDELPMAVLQNMLFLLDAAPKGRSNFRLERPT